VGIEPTMPVLQTGNLPLVDPAIQLLHQLQIEPPPSPANLGRSIHPESASPPRHLGPPRTLLGTMMALPLTILSQSHLPGEKPRWPLPLVLRTNRPIPVHHPLHIVLVTSSSFTAFHVLSLSQASPSSGLTREGHVQTGFHVRLLARRERWSRSTCHHLAPSV
jgi:hypothetical protein